MQVIGVREFEVAKAVLDGRKEHDLWCGINNSIFRTSVGTSSLCKVFFKVFLKKYMDSLRPFEATFFF